MIITSEFKNAVTSHNETLVKIMLKDSLLLDTTFKMFDEMLSYCVNRFDDFYMNDQDDDFSKDDDFNVLLGGLVNNFSRKRIVYLKEYISKTYGCKIESVKKNRETINSNTAEQRERVIIVKRIITEHRNMSHIINDIKKRNEYRINDIEEIEKISNDIADQCKKLKRKKVL